jgi:tetratricopeptide (TPR) repeat protein
MTAHGALEATLYWLGELTSARPHLEQAMALYHPQQPPRSAVATGDPRLDCRGFAAWTLWQLGYPDQALQRSHEAVALAEELSHPFGLAYTLGAASLFHLFRREGQLARGRAEALITLSTEQGFPYYLAWGMIMWGGALAEQGQVQEGIAQMRQRRNPFILALLAEAYGKVGQVEEGLTVLAEALAFVDKTGARAYEAELYRLKGELSRQSRQVETSQDKSEVTNPQSEAEACFWKAIDIARRQQAKSLELRAVMSLSRL